MRHIKKYGNRRLYCTESSAYVNLTQLADFIRAGEQVQVTDAKTGEDLTRGVLLQLLMEQQGSDLLPLGLLHRLVRLQLDAPLHGAALQQLSLGLRMLDQQLAQAEAQWPWMRSTSPTNPATPPAPEQSRPASAASRTPEDNDAAAHQDPELDALRQQLADLEARLRKA